MTASNSWLETFLEPHSEKVDRRSAERQPVDNFSAYRWNGSGLAQEPVKDISSTGLFILTEERWRPGTMLTLTLQRQGPLEMSPERRIEVRAKVVRCGEDGVGLAFVLKDDPESHQWVSLRESLIERAKPEDMLSLVRLVEAVAFLSRICPGEAEKVRQLVHDRLSNHQLANAVAIALKAESLLAVNPATNTQRASADLVVRIVEDGSCTGEDWLKDFWGGLLATSCAVDARDKSSLMFVEMFSKLATYLCRIRFNLLEAADKSGSKGSC